MCPHYRQTTLKTNVNGITQRLAVKDILQARIRALRSKDQGWQNVAGRRRGNGAKRNDLADWKPGAAEWRQSVNRLLSEVIFAII